MRTLKLRFSATNSIFSKLIQWRDWCDYSHVDVVQDDGTLLGADTDGGVKIRLANPAHRELILNIDVTDDQYDIITAAVSSQIGKKYDMLGVIGFVFNRNWEETDAWFCSELIAWSFKQGGINLLRFDNVSRISPGDLLLSPLLND